MNETFEPLIIGFCCNWCSYAGADLAGVSRIQYPTSLRIIRVMCSGMIHPNLVIEALTKGADGVLICGCHPGDCHYQEGNLKAEKRAEAIRLMEQLGIRTEIKIIGVQPKDISFGEGLSSELSGKTGKIVELVKNNIM